MLSTITYGITDPRTFCLNIVFLCSIKQEPSVKLETKFTKLVIVWNNQFLESVRLCTEKIPGNCRVE